MPLTKSEWLKVVIFLIGASIAMWFLFIRPHSYNWQVEGEAAEQIRTLLSNSNVIGSPEIKAVIDLENGRNTIITIPMRSDVRAGDDIVLMVESDVEKPSRKRYRFYGKRP